MKEPESTNPNCYSICCTPPAPDYNDLSKEDLQRYGSIVNILRKQGKSLEEAQKIAYRDVLCESIEF